jgi:hypothetical protein
MERAAPFPSRSARNLREHCMHLLPKSAASTPCPCLLLTKDLDISSHLLAYNPVRARPSSLLMPKGYSHDSNVLVTKQLPLSPECSV